MALVETKVMYRTDKGYEMDVGQMSSSHLMNAIAHHQKQLDVCERITSKNTERPVDVTQYIIRRVTLLRETIHVLQMELVMRDHTADWGDKDNRASEDHNQGAW